jgi:hypothetical protein
MIPFQVNAKSPSRQDARTLFETREIIDPAIAVSGLLDTVYQQCLERTSETVEAGQRQGGRTRTTGKERQVGMSSAA